MYFPNAFRKSFLVNAASNAVDIKAAGTALTSTALAAGQIGFINPSNYQTIAAPTAAPFIVAMGSHFTSDTIGVNGGYKESVKSKLINPKYITRVIKIGSKQAAQHVVKVSVSGGLDADSTYRLRLDVKGSPALRFLNHNLYRTLDAYTGCANTANPTYQKDPVAALLKWKDQVNASPILKDMVVARVFNAAGAAVAATSVASITTTGASITFAAAPAYAVAGVKVVGTGIPANAYITAKASNTITVAWPAQQVAPTISGTVSVSFYNDVNTDAGATITIPGTATSTNGTATAYSAAADAASFTYANGNPHIEFTAAYAETKFGSCTFTPTDKYDLEPLFIYASVVDESGNPCAVSNFVANSSTISASNPYLSSHGIQVQAPVQAQGSGETVLRELILDGRYLQNAYPDSGRVESLRMREIEADPALGKVSASAGYDRVIVLHSVPRFNNPSSTFDNDQYMLVFHIKTADVSSTGATEFADKFVTAAVAAGVSISREDY